MLGEHRRRHWGNVDAVAWHSSGTLLASHAYDDGVRVWDVATDREVAHFNDALCFAFAPKDQVLALGRPNGTVTLWDLATGMERGGYVQHEGFVVALAYSADGRSIASAGRDKTAKVWASETGKEIARYADNPGDAEWLAFAPDPKALAASYRVAPGQPRQVKVWNRATGQPTILSSKDSETPQQAPFAPDGRHLATANRNGTIYIFRLETTAKPRP